MNFARLASALILASAVLFLTGFIEKKTGSILQITDAVNLTRSYLDSGSVIDRDYRGLAGSLRELMLKKEADSPLHPDIFTNIFKIMKKILPDEKKPSQVIAGWKTYLNYLLFLKKQSELNVYYAATGVLAVIVTVLACALQRYWAALLFSRTAFFISRIGIVLTGIVVICSWMIVRSSYWTGAWTIVFSGLICFMVLAMFALKIHDPNYHVWNRFLKTMVFPLAYLLILFAGIFIS